MGPALQTMFTSSRLNKLKKTVNNIGNVGNSGGFECDSGPISWSLIPTRIPCTYSLATFLPLSKNAELELDIVFENEWKRRTVGMKVM